MIQGRKIRWIGGIALLLLLPVSAMGRECKSELGAHFKPLFGSDLLSWSMETTATQGWMELEGEDRSLRTGLLFTGLDIRPWKDSGHQFYLEGGWKDWYRSDDGPGEGEDEETEPERRHLWLREAFYRYDGHSSWLKVGLQSMNLGEGLLLDERVLGVSAMRAFGSFDVQLRAGSVATDFARMEDFCANRHTYQLLRGRRLSLVADALGETNLVAAKISWTPGKAVEEAPVQACALENDDGMAFADFGDEFAVFVREEENRLLERVSLIFMEEFGDGFHNYKYYVGGLLELALPWGIGMKLEGIGQYIEGEKTIGYMAEGQRDVTWRSGAFTDLSAGYMGRFRIDDDAFFYPTFGNLFMGEVMRLDAPALPLAYASAHHRFPWRLAPAIGISLVEQVGGADVTELDLTTGIRLFDGLRLEGVYSYGRTDLLEEDMQMGRLEFRWAF